MNKSEITYELVEDRENTHLRFFFISKGKENTDIIKIVQYSFLGEIRGEKLYNLGFGDYNPDTAAVNDEIISNNGDVYMVFNTVLHTIPLFFKNNPNSLLLVRGSDSRTDFILACQKECTKRCTANQCKNYNRRMSIYSNYVSKNYEQLMQDFNIWGEIKNATDDSIDFEQYTPTHKYEAILLQKIKR
jgi:hypothetical protein